jgi:hypothetical protein
LNYSAYLPDLRRPAFWVTVAVFAAGSYHLRAESHYWPAVPPGGAINVRGIVEWDIAVLLVGSAAGAALGALAGALARRLRRDPTVPFRSGYFVGLNVVALLIFVVVPSII